jgi:hypothetical protein
MNMGFADSFYFLALLNPKDAAHDKAAALSLSFRGQMVTTEWVITEVADAMAAPGNRRLFESFFAELTANPDITVLWSNEALFQRGLRLYFNHKDKDWPLTDCLSFVVMREMRIKDALTADRHFEQAGFRALLR